MLKIKQLSLLLPWFFGLLVFGFFLFPHSAFAQTDYRLYVASQTDNTVSVVDTASNTVIATIPVGQSPASNIAVSPDGSRAYVINGVSGTVSVIDASTYSVIATIPVGLQSSNLAIDPSGLHVYVPNADDATTVQVINTQTNSVESTITVGSHPGCSLVTPDGSKLYVDNVGSNTVSVIDPTSNTEVSRITVGRNPNGLGIGVVPNQAPTVGAITVTTSPTQVNTAISASASFTDLDTSDTHTASWNWGDGNTSSCPPNSSQCTLTETNGSGSVTGSHTYTTAGVYTVTLTVTDNHGAQGTATYQYVSVYNPTAQGLFSAAHKFTSPAGAYTQNSSLTGDATFGLSYKYQGTMPASDRQFTMNFKAANLLFNATTISSLVISNSMATLTGTGTINGSGSYNFLVTGVNGADIRVQITDSSNNVIYDTQPGAAITATPTTSVTGNVVVHN